MPRKSRKQGAALRSVPASNRQGRQKRRGPLVALNTEAIRKAAFRQIQTQRKALERETRKLDRFLHAEQPAFFRWFAGIAGELLTEMREAEMELNQLEGVVGEVQERVWFEGMTPQKAYAQVRMEEARRAAGEPVEPDDPEQSDPADPGEFEEAMRDEFKRFMHENVPPELRGSFQDEVRRFSKDAFGEDLSWLIDPASARSKKDASGFETHLKTLYRQLVSILHPDRRDPKLDPVISTELWHELQAAYHNRDLERLRTVYARMEYSLGIEPPQQTTVWELRGEAENHRVALRAVKNQIRMAQQHPAWQFSKRKDLNKLGDQLKKDLKQDIVSAREEINHLKSLLKSWETMQRKRKPASSQRRKSKTTWPPDPELF
jgi:hypothetical protein